MRETTKTITLLLYAMLVLLVLNAFLPADVGPGEQSGYNTFMEMKETAIAQADWKQPNHFSDGALYRLL
ncbi:MAG: hypothetical protein ACLVLH_21085 [Eisenbergiella massiliensis]